VIASRLPTRCYVTPARVAADLGVNQCKVLTWIHRGELGAVNVATQLGGRPRWRISEAQLQAFLVRRSAAPPPKVARRRKTRDSQIIEFF
jgi:excisionase family DNA binding protein